MTDEKGETSEGFSLSLEDEVSFVEGGIVSKSILDTAEAQVDLFCVASGQSLSEHTSSMDAMVHVIAGKGEISLGRRSFDARRGSWFYIPAGERHSIRSLENLVFVLTLVGKS